MLINEVYKSFNHVQYPIYVLNLEIDPELIDVNVLPDKTNVLIHNEARILESIRESLVEFYTLHDRVLIPKSMREQVPFNEQATTTIVELTSNQADTKVRTIDIKKFIKKEEEDSIDSLEPENVDSLSGHVGRASDVNEFASNNREFEVAQSIESTARTESLFCQDSELEEADSLEKPRLLTTQAQTRNGVEVLRSIDDRKLNELESIQSQLQANDFDNPKDTHKETIVETDNDADNDEVKETELVNGTHEGKRSPGSTGQ